MKLDYSPHPDDLKRVVGGLKLAGRIFLAAGATRVTPLTFRHLPSTTAEQLEDLDSQVRDNTDIELHTSHPQGGNPVSRDPAKGVVDERFRVHGMENLYVCDASVFPSAITVNPQLTVMALAEYAAAGIE
jgi:choline dehydrogenase-like flavoprotein